MINRKRLLKTLAELIAIDSQNPPGNEKNIALWVRDYLKRIDVPVRLYEFRKDRVSVVAKLSGPRNSQELLITPHLDTVPCGTGWKTDPFCMKIKADKLYGLGATDCKGNLACALEAMHSIVEDKKFLAYRLVFAATADEESGSAWGLIPLLDKGILHSDAAVVLDADDYELVIAQKGLLHMKVRVEGKRAHGAYPWLGINAIDIVLRILRDLKEYRFRAYRNNAYLHPPTMNIGTIRGGDKVNVVAGWCEFELDFRFLPGMSGEDIVKDVRKIVSKHARKFVLHHDGIQKPYCISKNHQLVKCLTQSMLNCNIRPRISGSEGATVITFFQDKNIPAVATGFGSEGCAHIVNEYAKLDNICNGAKVLEKFLLSYRF